MGNQFLDQYSILHFATGAIAYFWGVPALPWFLVHVTFEIAENTKPGMNFINNNLTWWPGGKPRSDNIENIVGDNFATMVGWWTAYKLDEIGKREHWYTASTI